MVLSVSWRASGELARLDIHNVSKDQRLVIYLITFGSLIGFTVSRLLDGLAAKLGTYAT